MLRGMESKFATLCHSHSEPPSGTKPFFYVIILKRSGEEEAQTLYYTNLHFKDSV